MTQIILKSDLDKKQEEVLFSLFKSWNVDVEAKQKRKIVRKQKRDFSLSAGMWKNYDIDAKNIRQQAWKLNK